MKTGLIITFGVYMLLSSLICVFAEPLLKVMATNPSIIESSIKYIRLEAIANVFGILQSFDEEKIVLKTKKDQMKLIRKS